MTFLDGLADDLSDVFFDTSRGFAATATTTGGGSIPGIFTKDYFQSDPGGAVVIQSAQPMFKAETSAATGVTANSILTIDGTAYTVVEVQPDESGIIDFRLKV